MCGNIENYKSWLRPSAHYRSECLLLDSSKLLSSIYYHGDERDYIRAAHSSWPAPGAARVVVRSMGAVWAVLCSQGLCLSPHQASQPLSEGQWYLHKYVWLQHVHVVDLRNLLLIESVRLHLLTGRLLFKDAHYYTRDYSLRWGCVKCEDVCLVRVCEVWGCVTCA